MPGSREWRWGYLWLSYGSEHVLVDLCDVGGGGQCLAVGCGGGHVVWGLCGGSCFLTDQQPIAKKKKQDQAINSKPISPETHFFQPDPNFPEFYNFPKTVPLSGDKCFNIGARGRNFTRNPY